MTSRSNEPLPALQVVVEPRAAAALLDPLRARLLRELTGEPASAAALAQRFGEPRQRLNYHLRELESAGLVELVKERRKGNCVERVMRATAGAFLLDPTAGAAGELEAGELQDRFSATALIALAARAVRDVARQRSAATVARKRLATLAIEVQVRIASPHAFAALTEEVAHAVAGVVARHHDAAATGGRSFRLLIGAYPAPPGATGQEREGKEGKHERRARKA